MSRTLFTSVNYLSSALMKENLSYFNFKLLRNPCQGKTCQGELVSVYSRQVFLDKCTCQGKRANVSACASHGNPDVRNDLVELANVNEA